MLAGSNLIIASLAFFLAGIVLLAVGLVRESIALEVASIVSALLSALVLYLAVRQRPPLPEAGAPPEPAGGDVPPLSAAAKMPVEPLAELEAPASAPRLSGATALDPASLAGATATGGGTSPDGTSAPAMADPSITGDATALAQQSGDLPPGRAAAGATAGTQFSEARQYADEPDEEPVRAADVSWISAQPDVVQVVDGHPRYHVGPCPSLRGQEAFLLPVSEAREIGFTPCGRCRPDATILDSAWRSHLNR